MFARGGSSYFERENTIIFNEYMYQSVQVNIQRVKKDSFNIFCGQIQQNEYFVKKVGSTLGPHLDLPVFSYHEENSP